MKKQDNNRSSTAFFIATILIFCLIFLTKDKNNKAAQAVTKQQTIQKAP